MCPSYRRRLSYRFSRRVSTRSCCPLTPGSPIRGDAADNLSGLTTRGPRCSYLQEGWGGEVTNFIFDLITLSVWLIGTPSSQDRHSTLSCRAALGSDTLFFFFFFRCMSRTIASFSLQSAGCDTWECVCYVKIAGFTYLLISLQVGRQRASSPSSHLKQEGRRKRRIRAGKDDECHN